MRDMLQNFDVPAWGYFLGESTCSMNLSYAGQMQISCSRFLTGPKTTVCDNIPVVFHPYLKSINVSADSSAVEGIFRFRHQHNDYLAGWFKNLSLLATAEGYNYLPISFSLTSFWLNELSAFFVDGEAYSGLSSPGYQYKTVDSTNNVSESSYNLHYLQGTQDRSLPIMWTSDRFSGWDLQGQSLSGSLVAFLSRTFEQVQACLALLSGGTTSNFGLSDTSSRVYSAVSEATAVAEEGESLCVAERLSRIESAVSQLIALTTYNYYVSGSSVDSAPSSGASVAEGVLNYLKQFLGDEVQPDIEGSSV